MKSIDTLIHVLATHPGEPDSLRTRVTIRLGCPSPGDRVWYEGIDRQRRFLTIASVEQGARLSSVVFTGTAENISGLARGTYVYAVGDGADQPKGRSDKS